MENALLNIVTSLIATFVYALISKYFLANLNKGEKSEKDNSIVKVMNMIISLLVYISTLIFLFIMSPILTGRWEEITDVGMFNVIKVSLAPLMIIAMGAILLAVIAISLIVMVNLTQKLKNEMSDNKTRIEELQNQILDNNKKIIGELKSIKEDTTVTTEGQGNANT